MAASRIIGLCKIKLAIDGEAERADVEAKPPRSVAVSRSG